MQKYLFYQILEQAQQAESDILELQNTVSELKAFLNQRQADYQFDVNRQSNSKNIGRSLSELKKLCSTELFELNTQFNGTLDHFQVTKRIYYWIEHNEALFKNNQALLLSAKAWIKEYHDFVNQYILEDYLNHHIDFNRNRLIASFDQLTNLLSKNYEKIYQYKRLDEALGEKKKQIELQENQENNQKIYILNILLYPLFSIKINQLLRLKAEVIWIEGQKDKLNQENIPMNIDLNTYERSCNQLISSLYLEEQLTFDPIFGKINPLTTPKKITSMLAEFDHQALEIPDHSSFWHQAQLKPMTLFVIAWLMIIQLFLMLFKHQDHLLPIDHSSKQSQGTSIDFKIKANKNILVELSEKSNDQTHVLIKNQQEPSKPIQSNRGYQKQIQIDKHIYPHPFQISFEPPLQQPNQGQPIQANLKSNVLPFDTAPKNINQFKKDEVYMDHQVQIGSFDRKIECTNDLACQSFERCIQNRCTPTMNPPTQSQKIWCDNACDFMVNQDDRDHIIPNEFNKIELYEYLKYSFAECYGISPNDEREQLCRAQALQACSDQCIQYDIENRHEEDPPKTEPLSHILPSTTGWHCMCYEEKGSVEDPKNVVITICRRNIENCISIQDRVLTVLQDQKNNKLIKGSVQYECTHINDLYPWRHNRSSYKWWSKSEKEGELQGKGQCLVADPQATISDQQKIELNDILRRKLFQRKYKENPSDYNDNQIKCLTDNINVNRIINHSDLTYQEINKIKNKCSHLVY